MTLAVFLAVSLAIALGLALFVSPRASSRPDGLERVAIDKGFAGNAKPHALDNGPAAEYALRGIDNARLSTGVAGLVGVAVTFAVAGGLCLLLIRRTRPANDAVGHGAT